MFARQSAASRQPQQEVITFRLVSDQPGLGKAGQIVQLALHPSDVHITEEIDVLIAGFEPFGFRSDEAAPPVLVDQSTDTYRTFGLNNAFKRTNVLTSDQGVINEVDPESSTSTYLTQPRALGGFISRRVDGMSSYDIRAQLGYAITDKLALDRELRVFGSTGLLCTSSNWNANNFVTIGAGVGWDDPDNGDPIIDLQERIEASAQLVTDIWFNTQVSHAFLRNKNVERYLRKVLGDNAPSPQTIEGNGVQQVLDYQLPGLPPIHVVPGKVLNETTGLLDLIMPDSVVLTSKPKGIPTNGRSPITAVSWRERGPSGNGYMTREFPVEARGMQGGTIMVSGHAEDLKMICDVAGGLIIDVIKG